MSYNDDSSSTDPKQTSNPRPYPAGGELRRSR